MKKLFLPLLFLLSIILCLHAQELNVSVSVNHPATQNTDPQVFKDLETTITEFLNTQKWTEDVFEPEERIEANVQINITDELSATEFKADVLIQSIRPVYGGDYQTVLLSHADKGVVFTYEQFQPLVYTKNIFIDNLTSVLSFYAYIIIGLDYDSFSPFGGDPYFQTAQDIVNNVPSSQTSKYKGWRSLDGNRNRFWIIENLLNPRVRPLRQSLYDYHRLGLDTMHENVETGRSIVATALEAIGSVHKDMPTGMIIQLFTNAKRNEVVEIFKKGDRQQKTKIKQLMTKMDASNATKYREIGR